MAYTFKRYGITYTQMCNYLTKAAEIDQQIKYITSKPCRHNANYIECTDTLIKDYKRISDYGIGANVVNATKCGYKPMGAINGETWEHANGNVRITICPSIDIPNYTVKNGKVEFTGKIADTPTKNYAKLGGRNLKYVAPPYLYDKTSAVYKVDVTSIFRSMLYIGKRLYRILALFGKYRDNYLYPVCRDQNTGAEYIETGPPYDNFYMRRQIAYGNWYQDYMPAELRYADHVTVHRPTLDTTAKYMSQQTGGFLAHPLYSYFRSASILYSNTPEAYKVTEDAAENDDGNLVFDFNVSDKNKWIKLIEMETLSNVHNGYSGDQFGGSRSTIYYQVTKKGLLIGASGEVGNRYEDECQMDGESNPYLSLWRDHKITLEMVHDCNARQVPDDGPFAGASFAGHGINIKARVKRMD